MSEEKRQFECVIAIRSSGFREAVVLWVEGWAREADILPEVWLEDNGDLGQFPEEPGVYRCAVSYDISAWGADDCEYSFTCDHAKLVASYPREAVDSEADYRDGTRDKRKAKRADQLERLATAIGVQVLAQSERGDGEQ